MKAVGKVIAILAVLSAGVFGLLVVADVISSEHARELFGKSALVWVIFLFTGGAFALLGGASSGAAAESAEKNQEPPVP